MTDLVLRRSAWRFLGFRAIASACCFVLALPFADCSAIASQASPIQTRIDGVVERTAARLGLPSVSMAVVSNGGLTYVRAFGAATARARFEIGSVSKQFTAACILLLQQDGRLSIDDSVVKYLPDVGKARDVTIRELLNQTSGYPDYYATLSDRALFGDTSVAKIVSTYTARPLDFAPGTAWEYSNTGYAVLTEIVERVSGTSYENFLKTRVFGPLHMASAVYLSKPQFGRATVVGYDRILLGTQRAARPEGRAWLNGAAGLAMTAHDLALWDIALLHHTILSATSTRAMYAEGHLSDDHATGYGLGVFVTRLRGQTIISHVGEVQGFTSENALFPDKDFGVVVLCNQENSAAPLYLAGAIAGAFGFFPASPDPPAGSIPIAPVATSIGDPAAARRVRESLEQLRDGRMRVSMLTAGEAAIANAPRLRRLQHALSRFGAPVAFENAQRERRAGIVESSAYIVFRHNRALKLTIGEAPDGKITDILIEPR